MMVKTENDVVADELVSVIRQIRWARSRKYRNKVRSLIEYGLAISQEVN